MLNARARARTHTQSKSGLLRVAHHVAPEKAKKSETNGQTDAAVCHSFSQSVSQSVCLCPSVPVPVLADSFNVQVALLMLSTTSAQP